MKNTTTRPMPDFIDVCDRAFRRELFHGDVEHTYYGQEYVHDALLIEETTSQGKALLFHFHRAPGGYVYWYEQFESHMTSIITKRFLGKTALLAAELDHIFLDSLSKVSFHVEEACFPWHTIALEKFAPFLITPVDGSLAIHTLSTVQITSHSPIHSMDHFASSFIDTHCRTP